MSAHAQLRAGALRGERMIRVKIFGPLGLFTKKLDAKGWLQLENGTTLKDALKQLGMPPFAAKFFLVRVNAVEVPLDTLLNDGDVIGFFSAISGG